MNIAEKCYKQMEERLNHKMQINEPEQFIIKKQIIKNFCRLNNTNDLNFLSKEITSMILRNNIFEERIIYSNNEYITIINYKF